MYTGTQKLPAIEKQSAMPHRRNREDTDQDSYSGLRDRYVFFNRSAVKIADKLMEASWDPLCRLNSAHDMYRHCPCQARPVLPAHALKSVVIITTSPRNMYAATRYISSSHLRAATVPTYHRNLGTWHSHKTFCSHCVNMAARRVQWQQNNQAAINAGGRPACLISSCSFTCPPTAPDDIQRHMHFSKDQDHKDW